MNWLDIVILLIVAASVFTSFRKGLSREIIGLISVVLALLLGIWFYGMAAGYLAPYLSSRAACNLCGFFLVFVAVLLLGSLTSYIFGKFLRVTGLSIVDHLLGAAFGLLRGALIAIALVTGIMAFAGGDRPPDAVLHSRLAPYVAGAAQLFADMAPHELKEGFRKRYAEAKTAWETALEERVHGRPRAEKINEQKRI
jgi:membrane protein required for colicin V production